jgi:predicted RecB family nuclease
MQKQGREVLFSAGDVVAFLECEHATTLALTDLETPLPRAEDDESLQLIQQKGFAHEAGFLSSLKAKGLRVAEVAADGTPAALARDTERAMREGYDVIFQAALLQAPFYGRADFLRRVEEPSALGAWRYEPADTKLARNPKAKFVLQLAFYSDLLSKTQGAEPRAMHLALGDGTERSYRVADFSRYYAQVRDRFLDFTAKGPNGTYPERCDYCPFCPWRNICNERWTADDHLNQVAGITRLQTERLQASGVRTLAALARLDAAAKVQKLQPESLEKLRSQAALQLERRQSGRPQVELLPLDPDGRRGFHRLPAPDAGDVFFDMEGDPFEAGGLEYLFGVRYSEGWKQHFRFFWAHNRTEEKQAFEALMDFLAERLARHPAMHIYHYAHYEPTALKRLMSLHGTREAQVDDLLRKGKLVDLYKVVREALRVSEGYSLKDVEAFYMGARKGEVRDAGASIVQYERWRESGDDRILEDIRRYNEDDCRSTELLRDWLVSQRPRGLPWFTPEVAPADTKSDKVKEIEVELERYRERLLGDLPADRAAWGRDEHVRELVFQLLDFHRRCAKPEWWAMFARMDMSEEELIDDVECLGGLRIDRTSKPIPECRSLIYTFTYPEQETKLRAGKDCVRADTAERLGTIVSLDEEKRLVRIKTTKNVPEALSIGPAGPIRTEILRTAVLRMADALFSGADRFRAVKAILRKDPPRLRKRSPGVPIIAGTGDLVEEAIAAVNALQDSYLFIQGPPGAGKTYTGSHLIVELLKRRKRVGVTSNSHKAINNLLAEVEKCAAEQGVSFSGVKKFSTTDPESRFDGRFIESIGDAATAIESNAQLLAGTAWLFAEPALEGSLDYLFVDEAGQVSLANLVAAGTAAKNLVLLGDQMQLGQPIQGVHPGRSGESTLEYLLEGLATIPPGRGIFLPTSFRMHEHVCRFISDAVYDGRLHPEPANQRQTLLLDERAHPALRPTGIVFLPVAHDGNSQRSSEEAEMIKALYASLLEQRFRDKEGKERRMGPENVLVVAPYNSQVNLLKSVLPPGARVGTIDKFQGQQAEAVLISMATSSGDYLPRNIEFLYDKNRLNVAISRAKCLAVVVANPALLQIRCTTPEQMELVNTLCWVSRYASQYAACDSRNASV